MSSWSYLIRFEADDSKTYFASLSDSTIPQGQVDGFASFAELESGGETKKVSISRLLSPTPVQGQAITCIGLNYKNHATEANLPISGDPPMRYKPWRALADPGDIPIPKAAQDNFLDYEGELTFITSKDARDVTVEQAADYILGYTVGNDLTARLFQAPTRSGGQFTFAKAFDNYKDKQIRTKVNGRVVQDSSLDLIRSPEELIIFLSQGTTVPAGTPIMTGTPSGVGWFQEPKSNLKDGDVVEIEIDSIGTLKNTMRYEK